MTRRGWDHVAAGTAAGSVLVLLGDGRMATLPSGPGEGATSGALAELARTLPPHLARQCRRARRRLLRGQLRETRRANSASRRRPAPETPLRGPAP